MIFVLIKVCRKLPEQDFALVDEIRNCRLAHNLSQSLAKSYIQMKCRFRTFNLMQLCHTQYTGMPFFKTPENIKLLEFQWRIAPPHSSWIQAEQRHSFEQLLDTH